VLGVDHPKFLTALSCCEVCFVYCLPSVNVTEQFEEINSLLARWYDSLQEYDYEVKYRPGARMSHEDALSRVPDASDEWELDEELVEKYEVCVLMTEE